MPRAREEDMREHIPIPMKPLVPAIPTDDGELRELGEDLWRMGCEGLLGQPWNVQEDNVLREFKFARVISGKAQKGGIRKIGLRIPGLEFTGSREGEVKETC
jgi:hypothetical protein